jgi:hypothetical protein
VVQVEEVRGAITGDGISSLIPTLRSTSARSRPRSARLAACPTPPSDQSFTRVMDAAGRGAYDEFLIDAWLP